MTTRKTKRLSLLASLALMPALLTGCPIYVDSWEVTGDGPYGSGFGTSPDVVIVGDTTGWIDIDRPRYTEKKGTTALNPVINSFSANITDVKPGQPITFTVVANDPGNQPLQYNWSSTGGTLSTNTGQIISWDPPERAGIYTVQVIVSNARGGATTGSLNLTVKASALTPTSVPSLTPTPVATAAPTAVPTPAPTPAPTAAPTVAPAPTPKPSATAKPAVEPATIAGVVKDDQGPLAGATVLLTSGDPQTPFEETMTTGADGRFLFPKVPPGVRLVLSARKAGYSEKLRTIQALSGTETVFDFAGTFALQKL
jgi:hypothetical protein